MSTRRTDCGTHKPWTPANGKFWADETDDSIDYDSLLDELPWDRESLERPDAAPAYDVDDVYEPAPAVPAASTASTASTAPPAPTATPAPPAPTAATAKEASDEFARFSDGIARTVPPSQEFWWNGSLPKSTMVIFNDPTLLHCLCMYCRSMGNLGLDESGRVVKTLCPACRCIVGQYKSNRCPRCPDRPNARYVDEVGALAAMCQDCHTRENGPRAPPEKAKRRRGVRGGRRARQRATAQKN